MLEEAAKKQLPLLIFFVEEGMDVLDAARIMTGKRMAKMAATDAKFIMIEYNGDRTPSLDDDSPVPTSKILGPNPSRDYNIRKYPTFLVCDSYGNECYRSTKPISESTLEKQFENVGKKMSATSAKLSTNLAAARKALDKKQTSKVFKALLKNFKADVVGLDVQQESIRVYREIMDNAREEIDELLEDGDASGIKRLKAMKKAFKVTELKGEIEDAIDILKG